MPLNGYEGEVDRRDPEIRKVSWKYLRHQHGHCQLAGVEWFNGMERGQRIRIIFPIGTTLAIDWISRIALSDIGIYLQHHGIFNDFSEGNISNIDAVYRKVYWFGNFALLIFKKMSVLS